MAEKSFADAMGRGNPALSFISGARQEDGAARKEGQAQQVYTLEEAAAILQKTRGAAFAEKKSRRLHLLVTPSLFAEIKEEARRRDISINAVANEILEEGMRKKR